MASEEITPNAEDVLADALAEISARCSIEADRETIMKAVNALRFKYPNPMQFVNARGDTMEAMRKAVWEDGLGAIGDAILIWVNEGDFLHLQMNGGAALVPNGDHRA